MSTLNRKDVRRKVRVRIRKKISGTSERPRLAVFFSNQHVYAQLIDDTKSHTLCASCTKTLGLKKANVETASKVGEEIAKKALAAGITEVVFDRGGFLYHGKVKSLADAAREAGLKF
ncbi:MAG: 50S ribosomal protein L18 [Akkermansiaceae bacterium]|nr:50S ribosomal protein L18 [Akkermansiaceae bacterium]